MSSIISLRRILREGGLRDLERAYLRRRYAILFYTLLFTMVGAPVFAASWSRESSSVSRTGFLSKFAQARSLPPVISPEQVLYISASLRSQRSAMATSCRART